MNNYRGYTLEQMFDLKTPERPDNACWPWAGTIASTGYAKMKHNRKMLSGHRVSYELHKGRIPSGMYVCHSCDNKICTNPNHLWLGTPADNMNDKVAKGRQSKGVAHAETFRNSPLFKQNTPRGERHGQSKVTDQQRLIIIDRVRSGEVQRAIAEDYGITPSSVSLIWCKFQKESVQEFA